MTRRGRYAENVIHGLWKKRRMAIRREWKLKVNGMGRMGG
jgi:hypothetical protein